MRISSLFNGFLFENSHPQTYSLPACPPSRLGLAVSASAHRLQRVLYLYRWLPASVPHPVSPVPKRVYKSPRWTPPDLTLCPGPGLVGGGGRCKDFHVDPMMARGPPLSHPTPGSCAPASGFTAAYPPPHPVSQHPRMGLSVAASASLHLLHLEAKGQGMKVHRSKQGLFPVSVVRSCFRLWTGCPQDKAVHMGLDSPLISR